MYSNTQVNHRNCNHYDNKPQTNFLPTISDSFFGARSTTYACPPRLPIRLNWFKSYLTDRTQIYTHGGSQTPSFSVDCSFPQGSVFGPLGFASYTEDVVDLMDRHNVQFLLYADDTQFLDCCRSTDTVSL